MGKAYKGQSMFEVIVAIAISSLIIVAIVSLVTNSIRNSIYSKNESAASDLAQKAVEWLRSQRDENTTDFLLKVSPSGAPATFCFQSLDWTKSIPCSAGDEVDSIFLRQGNFTTSQNDGKTIIEAEVEVTWNDSQGNHKVVNSTDFSDWRQR